MSAPEDRTRALIGELSGDLAPVRRFPSLPAAMAIMGAVWIGMTAVVAAVLGPKLETLQSLVSHAGFVAVAIGLAATAFGGALASIAGVVPGREDVERRAREVAWIGLALAGGAAVVGVVSTPGALLRPLAADAACFQLATIVGAVPAVVLLALQRWGFVARPGRAGTLALLGAFGLGALAVQMVCHYLDARHMLFAHIGVPVVVTAVLLVPVALLLRASARARRRGA